MNDGAAFVPAGEAGWDMLCTLAVTGFGFGLAAGWAGRLGIGRRMLLVSVTFMGSSLSAVQTANHAPGQEMVRQPPLRSRSAEIADPRQDLR